MPTKRDAEEAKRRGEENAAKKTKMHNGEATEVKQLHPGGESDELQGRRDVKGWASCGFIISTTSNEAARMLDLSIEQVIGWFGDPYQTAASSSEADPCWVIPYCIMIWLKYLGASAGEDDPVLIENLAKAEKALSEREHSEREVLLFHCLKELSGGKFEESLLLVEDYLSQYPRDAMGLKLQNDICYFTGQNFRMRDGVARCLPEMDEETPFYGYILGMYAFVLEESFEYDKGKAEEMIRLLIESKDNWEHSNLRHAPFSQKLALNDFICRCHISWHLALSYLDLGVFSHL
eukprot:752594-Hanusia_phi.AAC.7